MFAAILELITGKDDLERVACRNDAHELNRYLETRRVIIPKRPTRFLDAANFTQAELLEQIQNDSEDLANSPFEPWIFENSGKKSLPAFSSLKRAEVFSSKVSQELNKVFSLGFASVLLSAATKGQDLDFVQLNLFNKLSWEIAIRSIKRE